MANFVVSVEKIQTTFTAAGTNTVNLSKSQAEAKCVPFYTMRFTATGNDNRSQNAVKITMIDNGGTPAAQVEWNPVGNPAGDITVDIFVVEFGANVTVQSATLSLTGASAAATITSVTQANSFITFTQQASGGGDDWEDSLCQARFNSDTEIQFERPGLGNPDWDIRWYVVTSDGTDFTTEYIEDSWTTTEVGPTNLTITSVTQTKAFLICTQETDENDDDMLNAATNQAITADTTLTWYRNHAATPHEAGTLGTWVVKTTGTEFSVQRFATDVDAATSTTQAITAIDQTKAIIVANQNMAYSSWPITSSIGGNDIEKWQHSLVFSSDSEVTLQRRLETAIDGSNNNIRFEVVEFELEAAVQTAFPFADITSGGWLPEIAGSPSFTGSPTELFAMIDEATADDTDFIHSSLTPSNDLCEVRLQTLGDPAVSTGHIVRYRYSKDPGAGRVDLTVKLMQGVTEIASFTHTDIPAAWTQADQTLSAAQADSISDYGDLRLRFTADQP